MWDIKREGVSRLLGENWSNYRGKSSWRVLGIWEMSFPGRGVVTGVSENSTRKELLQVNNKKATQFKNGQWLQIDSSSKKIHRWAVSR